MSLFLVVLFPLLKVLRVYGSWVNLMEPPAVLKQQNERTKLLTIDSAICLLTYPTRWNIVLYMLL